MRNMWKLSKQVKLPIDSYIKTYDQEIYETKIEGDSVKIKI
jgi:hypothetical protein